MQHENSKKKVDRGLSALFGDQKEEPNKIDKNLSQKSALIGNLSRNKYQPRNVFDEQKLEELAKSIKKNGIIQPIAVRKTGKNEGEYEIVAGERRWLAAQKAGLHEVPITVLDLTDNETLEVAIVENIQRENLNIIEEAKGYERLNKEFEYDQEKNSKINVKKSIHISNTLRLLTLPKDIITMLQDGEITSPSKTVSWHAKCFQYSRRNSF